MGGREIKRKMEEEAAGENEKGWMLNVQSFACLLIFVLFFPFVQLTPNENRSNGMEISWWKEQPTMLSMECSGWHFTVFYRRRRCHSLSSSTKHTAWKRSTNVSYSSPFRFPIENRLNPHIFQAETTTPTNSRFSNSVRPSRKMFRKTFLDWKFVRKVWIGKIVLPRKNPEKSTFPARKFIWFKFSRKKSWLKNVWIIFP